MQYLMLIYIDERRFQEQGEDELKELTAAYARYTAALEAGGVLRGGAELAPVRSATTVRVRAGKTMCTDGPFAETKEQLGGYYLIEAPNLDEALAWAARCPGALDGSVEVRPLV